MMELSTKKNKEKVFYGDLAIAALGVVAIDISLNFSWAEAGVYALGLACLSLLFWATTKSLNSKAVTTLLCHTNTKAIITLCVTVAIVLFYATEAYAVWFASEREYLENEVTALFANYTGNSIPTEAISGALQLAVGLFIWAIRAGIIFRVGVKFFEAWNAGDEGETKRKAIMVGIATAIIAVMFDAAGNLLVPTNAGVEAT